MEKVLTIVVPTYNMEKYLDRCLTSLIIDEAHMDMLEVLVINDGSKDRSSEIAHSYEDKYPGTFRVIDKENGNYGSCVNRGLAEANGKYIKILDADDSFYTENFTRYIEFLAACESDLVITQTCDDNLSSQTKSYLLFDDIRKDNFTLSEIGDHDISYLFMHSITYKAEIVRSIGYQQITGISYTDLQWACEPMISVKSCSIFREVVYNYTIGREGQTVDMVPHCKNLWMEEKVILHVISFIEEHRETTAPENICFLEKRVSNLTIKIYYYYLYMCSSLLEEDDLVKFDSAIHKASPKVYSLVEDGTLSSRFFNFKYIKEWRLQGGRKGIKYFLFDKYNQLKSIAKI
ncbi:MAG: glycosyltransferase [Bacteroidales bacterium]|nr:glycosyltransferase [Bacteroidales bacterium]